MMIWSVLALLAAFVVLLAVFSVWNLISILKGAPYVPSARVQIDAMIFLAELRSNDVVLDLGAGDGRILRKIAPYVRDARGVEINPPLVWYARIANRLAGHKHIKMLNQDFWNSSLADIDVLFVYCIDSKMDMLEKKVVQEMKKGAKIVSNGFVFPTLHPQQKKEGVMLYIL